MANEHTYILVGDIVHPGHVRVSAKSLDEAIEKAENGQFEIWNEASSDGVIFRFCGDTEGGVEQL